MVLNFKEDTVYQEIADLTMAVDLVVAVITVEEELLMPQEKEAVAVADHLGRGHLLVRHFKAEFAQEMDKSLLVGSSFIKLNSFYLNSIKY
jgi:hypothetical protein